MYVLRGMFKRTKEGYRDVIVTEDCDELWRTAYKHVYMELYPTRTIVWCVVNYGPEMVVIGRYDKYMVVKRKVWGGVPKDKKIMNHNEIMRFFNFTY